MKSRSHPHRTRNASSTRWLLHIATVGLGAVLIWALKIVRQRARLYQCDLRNAARELPVAPQLKNAERVLLIAPHPDDETLGTGALISQARQKGLDVCVVFLTNGDGSGSSYLAQQLREGNRPSFQELAATRQNEARAALHELNVAPENVIFLGYPDGGLGEISREHPNQNAPYFSRFTKQKSVPYENAPSFGQAFCRENIVRDLLHILEEFKPTRLYTTDENDTHADHVAAFEFAQEALCDWRETSSTQSSRNARFFTFLVHYHIWPVPHGQHLGAPLSSPSALSHLNWTHLIVDSDTLKRKQRALSCYRSQLVWTPLYLRSFLRRTELFREIDF